MSLESVRRQLEADPENTELLLRYVTLLKRHDVTDPLAGSLIYQAFSRIGNSYLDNPTKINFYRSKREMSSLLEGLLHIDKNLFAHYVWIFRRFLVTFKLYDYLREARKSIGVAPFHRIIDTFLENAGSDVPSILESIADPVRSENLTRDEEAAVNRLKLVGDARATQPLLHLLESKEVTSPLFIPYRIIDALGYIGDPSCLPLLFSDYVNNCQQSVAEALGYFPENPMIIDYLFDIVNNSEVHYMVGTAILSLQYFNDPRILPFFESKLESETRGPVVSSLNLAIMRIKGIRHPIRRQSP